MSWLPAQSFWVEVGGGEGVCPPAQLWWRKNPWVNLPVSCFSKQRHSYFLPFVSNFFSLTARKKHPTPFCLSSTWLRPRWTPPSGARFALGSMMCLIRLQLFLHLSPPSPHTTSGLRQQGLSYAYSSRSLHSVGCVVRHLLKFLIGDGRLV